MIQDLASRSRRVGSDSRALARESGLTETYLTIRLWMASSALILDAVFASIEGRFELWIMVAASIPSVVDGVRTRRRPPASLVRPVLLDITGAGVMITVAGLAPVAVAHGLLLLGTTSALLKGRWVHALQGVVVAWMLVAMIAADVFDLTARWNPTTALAFTILNLVMTMSGMVGMMKLTMDRLNQVEQQRSRLIGGFTHDLKNALTSAVGIAQLLSSHLDDLDAEEIIEYSQIVMSESSEAVAMTEDLLAITRDQADELKIAAQEVDLGAEASRVLEAMGSGHIPIRVAESQRSACIGDPIRTRQIIRNLVSNAQRHGGQTIEIDVVSSDDTVALRVRDDGEPIPVEDRERIFHSYQTANGQSRHAESIGLGLSISRRLARLMGGDLVYRHTDGWAEFELMLPAHRSGSDRADGTPVITTRAERVWLGDDGIMRSRVLPDAEIRLEDAQEGVIAYTRLMRDRKRPLMVLAEDVKFLARAARDHYTRSHEAQRCTSAVALVVSASPIARVIANYINRYNAGPIPTRLFADEAGALAWLTDFADPHGTTSPL